MRKKRVSKKNKHLGSDFDDFLREEGILEASEEVAAKYVFVMQLEDEMEKQNLTKDELAKEWERVALPLTGFLIQGNLQT